MPLLGSVKVFVGDAVWIFDGRLFQSALALHVPGAAEGGAVQRFGSASFEWYIARNSITNGTTISVARKIPALFGE